MSFETLEGEENTLLFRIYSRKRINSHHTARTKQIVHFEIP